MHCIEKATINDVDDVGTMISNFANMKGSSAEPLRNTADATALLVNDFGACGVAYLGRKSFFT